VVLGEAIGVNRVGSGENKVAGSASDAVIDGDRNLEGTLAEVTGTD